MALEAPRGALQTVGNYELLDKIADGGMGSVFKGRHRTNGQIVAIKVVPANMANNAVLLKRFEQEFRAASKLDHPHIVRALDFGQEGSTPYLVMEYIDGESLGQKIDRDGRLPETEALRLICQVAQGLHKAHKHGLVHRDVKPDNILIGSDGQAKLADLGLVKEIETDLNLTRTGRGLGTPHFMAPEQFRNAKNADVRCDLYSLAATLYMAVTGDLPFKSCSPLDAWMKKMRDDLTPARDVVPTLCERTDWAIRRAMCHEPDQRPANCREFVEDLTGRSTKRTPPVSVDGAPQSHDMWYLYYKDEEGSPHTVKGSVYAIRRSLKEGLLGDASNIRASREKGGPFEALRAFPEFRDLVITPSPSPAPKVRGKNETAKPASDVPTLVTTPTPVGSTYRPPHFDVASSSARGFDWKTWTLMGLVAAATALVTFYLINGKFW